MEVTHVAITHGHADHCLRLLDERVGKRPRFLNARHFIHRLDAEGTAAPEASFRELRDLLDPLEAAGLLEVIDGAETEVAPGVTMLHTGAESPGHCVVRIKRGAYVLFYLGDLFHLHEEVAHPSWTLKGRDQEETIASRRRILAEAEASKAALVMTHDPSTPPWGAVTKVAPDSWRWSHL
jgi:glyoxylase-like metal-dependent hydrolase (beta-lactamase superfamily II)